MKQIEQQISIYLSDPNRQKKIGLQKTPTVNFLAQGEYNQNYMIDDGVKKLVFRINYGSQLELDKQITYEYRALECLEKSLRTPKPIYLDDSQSFFNQGILVMEFLEGRPLDYQQDLTEAAHILAAVHSMPVDEVAVERFILEKEHFLEARLTECQRLLEPVFISPYISLKDKRLLDQAYGRCENQVNQQAVFNELDMWTVNNTEVNSHNFIIGKEQGWLIDWEKPVISHPCQDLTQFLASTTTLWRSDVCLTQAEKALFLAEYLKKSQLNKEAICTGIRCYSPFLMLRALAWSAMAYDSYCSQKKALQNQAIFKKVTEFLEPDFLRTALREKVIE